MNRPDNKRKFNTKQVIDMQVEYKPPWPPHHVMQRQGKEERPQVGRSGDSVGLHPVVMVLSLKIFAWEIIKHKKSIKRRHKTLVWP
jgi:hypothetical protein